MTKLMHRGYSWSGRERDCVFLNTGGRRFADVSSAAGLDFEDDGRAVAAVDWDDDGDLDLWYRNRTGPQMRFMRNDLPSGQHFIALDLVGKTCNRDAVGTVVEVHAAGRKHVRTNFCGDGYLSQSSRRLHFGLGSTDAVDRVVIRWPGGAPQVLQGLAADRRYRIEQGADSAVEVPRRDIRIADSPPTAPQVPAFAPIVLRIPLRLPPSLAGALTGVAVRDSSPRADSRGTLMVPWAQWCAPCIEELRELVRRQKELLDAGLQILPVNLDENADREKAERLFKEKIEPLATGDAAPVSVNAADSVKEALDAVLMHVRDEESGPWPMPVSLLIDKNRTLQVVYVGPVSPKQLAADLRSYCGDQPPKLALRGRFEGRWYFRSPRDWDSLARDLEKRGLIEDARFIKNTYLTGAREDP